MGTYGGTMGRGLDIGRGTRAMDAETSGDKFVLGIEDNMV
jgi:hypothetical protein